VGAAVYGELGARLPRAGGDYQYLAMAFGPVWGFLMGWAALLLTFSAAAAAMCLVALDNLGTALAIPWGGGAIRSGAAAAAVLALTGANIAGARVAGRTTAVFTAIPLAGLLGLFAVGFATGSTEIAAPPLLADPGGAWLLALGVAMIPVFFTYSGWNAAAYMAAEIRDPGRNLIRGLLGGCLLVTGVYLAVNVVLLVTLPQGELAGSTTAVAQAAERLVGPAAQRILSLFIAFAVLGSANVTLMAGARIYYAMAVDRLAPSFLTRTNPAGVPSSALWLGGLWTAVLTFAADVGQLVEWTTLAILLLSSLTMAALFVLRRRGGEAPAYRCPGYPVTPALYILASLGVAGATAVYRPWWQTLVGTLLLAAGLPLFFLARRWMGGPAQEGE
jgi:APA family basic amino acid/polyamine antiporter